MREQTQELLSRLARQEDDPATDAPPIVVKLVRNPDEVAIRIHAGDDAEWFRARRSDLRELDRLDLIRSDREIGAAARCEICLTATGRQTYEDSKHKIVVLEPLLPTPGSNILDWQTEALPVLQAAYEAYSRTPLSMGIARDYVNQVLGRPSDDPRTTLVLAALAEDGYITSVMDTDQDDAPLFFKLGERGRQVLAGWPGSSGADSVQALIVALDRQIAAASSDEERGRLSRLKDALIGVGTDLAAKVLANMAS